MGKKIEIISELAKISGRLKDRPSMTAEEIAQRGDNMPIGWMTEPALVCRYIDETGMNLVDGAHFADWVLALQDVLRKISFKGDVLYKDFYTAYEKARTQFIIIHRVNYMLHETMVEVADLLEREKRLKLSVKKCWNLAEKVWQQYKNPHQKDMELSAWSTLQDHMDISYCDLQPLLETVYETVRDYMIRLGYRDVELKARCCVVFLMGKVACASYHQFFEDFLNNTHIDFEKCYTSSDMQPLVRWFAAMCKPLGMKTRTDEYGFCELDGFEPDGNQRVKTAWSAFMKALRDDDRMDESARRALELNPKAKEKYLHAVEEGKRAMDEQKQAEMEEGFRMLEEKYKVIKTDKTKVKNTSTLNERACQAC